MPDRLALATAEQPLYLLNLDGFKAVNDSLGHDAGDLLLQEVAQRLRRQLRADDPVCRLGGDELLVAVSHLKSLDDAEALGQKLSRAFDSPAQVGASTCKVGVTVGHALAPQGERAAPGLIKRADAALHAGQHADKNRVIRGAVASVASRL